MIGCEPGDAPGPCDRGPIAPEVFDGDARSIAPFVPVTEFHARATVREHDSVRGLLTFDFHDGDPAHIEYVLREGLPLPVTVGQVVELDAYFEDGWTPRRTMEVRDVDGSLLATVWNMIGSFGGDWESLALSYEDGACPSRIDECGTVLDRTLRVETVKRGEVVVPPGFEVELEGYRIANGQWSMRYVGETVRCTDLPGETSTGYAVRDRPKAPTFEPDGGFEDDDAGRRVAADAFRGRCPKGLPGSPLVEVPAPEGASFEAYCMDATEVTNADYAEFVFARPSLEGQEGACVANRSYAPSQQGDCARRYDLEVRRHHPIVCVDWCDARAYCQWAGKRLCGRIGGGASDYAEPWNVRTGEWMNACSAAGAMLYPYGEDYDAAKCESTGASCAVEPVGTRDGCEGGFPGLRDLSGNVSEWEDACSGSGDDLGDACLTRGGAGCKQPSYLACDGGEPWPREGLADFVGIRCCASL
jgi:formylglycine-generating enzyme required for sulfatase activity